MAVIFDKEWNSLTEYDGQLKEIRHFSLHPEMLPYVGRHYNETRILLIGESHYLSNYESEEVRNMNAWYESPTDDYSFEYKENIETRWVIRKFLTGRRTKAYSMFSNPAKALTDAWDLGELYDGEAFTGFAFYNYFQRPARNAGKSIVMGEEDERQAFFIMNRIVDILKPEKVIFLSKKAADSFTYQGGDLDEKRFHFVYHPTSKYWHEAEGKKKLCRIFAGMKKYEGFAPNGYLSYTKAKSIIDDSTALLIDKRKKRFYENDVTCRIYTNKDGSVSEAAWYLQENRGKYGIGFLIKTHILWIWDYNKKKYMSESDLENSTRLKELYKMAVGAIKAF